jgi:molecular chaperone GrpE
MKESEHNLETGTEIPQGAEPSEEAIPGQDGTETSMDPVTLTAVEYRGLLDKAVKADQNWETFLRERAELENLRKRVAREKQDAIRYANEGLIADLLPILDNFEMALLATDQATDLNVEALKTGVSMIHGQFKNLLLDSGLQEIDATGKPFDPAIHDALGEEISQSIPDGNVIRQTRKGYKLRDRLIRAASVIVARKEQKPTNKSLTPDNLPGPDADLDSASHS